MQTPSQTRPATRVLLHHENHPDPRQDPPAAMTDLIPVVDRFLDQRTASLDLPENLRDAVRYALLGGGKHFRPVLTLHACLVAGGNLQDALPPAAAIEFIHAFSLVHDDLPAMDDDDLRRGRPTLHIVCGEAMAILAGDALMTLAFQILHEDVHPDTLAAALCHELAVATTGMIAGQVYDTLGGFTPGASDLQRLAIIHHNKTGALIRASCRMGALAASASPETLQALTEFGEAVGLMFQIVDDLIDVEQSAEHTGKRTGKDLEAGKFTYPGVLGVEQSRAEVEKQRARALQALQPLGAAADPLRELSDFLAVRTR